MNCDLVLQHLSEVDTDYLVECGLEIARRYRQLEEENESYRQRKEVFASLYEEERGKVKELKTKLAETNRAMEKMKENANVLEQVRQDYLKERRQLEAECERLRCVLKHDEEEWAKEKQQLLEQIRNVRSEQRIEKERKELGRINIGNLWLVNIPLIIVLGEIGCDILPVCYIYGMYNSTRWAVYPGVIPLLIVAS